MDTTKTERQNHHITPFTYEDRAVRTVLIEDEPWFIAKDVGDALGLSAIKTTLQNFPENEKGVHTVYTPGGPQEMLIVNEPGLYRLIFQSRKSGAERFKTWVFTGVLPEIRRTGAYGNGQGGIDTGAIYSLFSGDPSMTVRQINKFIYYQALDPPLAGNDIARLLGANASTVSYWRKWVPAEAARAAVKKLGLTAQGGSEYAPSHSKTRDWKFRQSPLPGPLPERTEEDAGERAGFPLELPPHREERPGFPVDLPPQRSAK